MDKNQHIKNVREIASEGMVLFENDGTLPLDKNERIAAFGRTFYFCFKGGAGSGDVLGVNPIHPHEAMAERGLPIDAEIANYYQKYNAERYESELRYWSRFNCRWVNNLEEATIPKELIAAAAKRCETAVVHIARNSSEWLDIPADKGGFYLTDAENELIENVKQYFKKIVLVLNTAGVTDPETVKNYKFNSVLYSSMGGEQMGNSLIDVLYGDVNPSGKLASTWADIKAFPTNKCFQELSIPYEEGIYVGYRYFDSFGIKPTYPFGFGMSYTSFDITHIGTELCGSKVTVTASVKNTGACSGKEVVQLYLSEPKGKLHKAYQQLSSFAKTKLLEPDCSETVALNFDLCDFAAYNEDTAEFILEAGNYYLRLGNSSRNTHIVAAIHIDNTICTYKTANRCAPKQPIDLISAADAIPFTYPIEAKEMENCQKLILDSSCITVKTPKVSKEKEFIKTGDYTLLDVKNGICSVEEFVAQLSCEELADILNGVTGATITGSVHVGTMAKKIQGAAGEILSNEKYGIPANVNADGPAGIRLGRFINKEGEIPEDTELSLKMTAYPIATCVANTWNPQMAEMLGRGVSSDMNIADLDGWLAPSMNIHRNPLCGRNFEYYSEDPLVSGKMAAATVIGAQQDESGNPTGHYATVKHFAANNAEKHRFDSDSIISERALREIYLKGFQIAVKEAKPLAVMNSYNKVNGIYASDNYELNTEILRNEWGFDGCVMTDWCAKSSSYEMSKAGCDLVMPGLKNKEYLEGIGDGRIPLAAARKSAVNIINLVLRTSIK